MSEGSVGGSAKGRRKIGHVSKNDSCRAHGKMGERGTNRCR